MSAQKLIDNIKNKELKDEINKIQVDECLTRRSLDHEKTKKTQRYDE